MSGPISGGQASEAERPRSPRTRTVRAGEPTGARRPISEPIAPGTVYAFADPAEADAVYAADPPGTVYARDGLPDARALEAAIADLEGAEAAVATASGMAAIGMAFLALLAAGDEVILAPGAYCDTESILTEELALFGDRAVFADLGDPAAVRAALTPRTRLIHAETISNPSIRLADLPGLAAVARQAGVLLAVDNTLATPLLCRPLEHGADLVIHSVTKFLGGHHDLVAGVVAGRRELIDRIRRCAYLFGPMPGPFAAWLALRGIRTLAPRMAWIVRTAEQVAGFLAAHPAVAAVRYPGLPSFDQADLARRLLPAGGGGLLTFELAGGPRAAYTLLRNLRLIPYAPSLGGTTTTASYPPVSRTNPDYARRPTPDRSAVVRLSLGLEDPADLIADLAQALAALPGALDDAAATKGSGTRP